MALVDRREVPSSVANCVGSPRFRRSCADREKRPTPILGDCSKWMLVAGSEARIPHDVHQGGEVIMIGFGRALVARVENASELGVLLDPQIVDYLAGACGLRLLCSIC